MNLTWNQRAGLAVLAVATLLLVNSSGPAQRPRRGTETGPPTATGKVVAYEAAKSITVEVKKRGGEVQKLEFAIVKDKTKVELQGATKAIEVGTQVRVWADKDNPKTAARIAAGTSAAAAAPTATGKVVAYEADKSVTVEVKKRGGEVQKLEFAIVKDKTKVELQGATKAIEVGTQVRVWADKDNPKTAARITAGTARRPGRRPAVPPDSPVKPVPAKGERAKQPDAPSIKATAQPTPAKNKKSGNARAPQAVARAIDQEIQRVLDADRVRPSGQADDAEFLRRVYLDLTGRIPAPEKAAAFLDSKDADKRARLIDELLASKDYGLHFADLWCDRLNVKDMPIYREPFIGWMADSLNQDRGWDKVVFDLVTAGGKFNFITRGRRLGSTDPQALLILLNTEDVRGGGKPNPAWLAAESGRLFLGVQLQCAECHNHPFTKSWKQTDFWGLAAFFGQLRSERVPPGGLQWNETPAAANKPVSMVIPPTALKNIGQTVPARLPGGKEYQPADEQLLRHALARWMTAADNPFFARAAANRTWAHLFGRGLVDPVDDLREDNPPSHPGILELLADEFKKSEFDLKYLIRCICLSQAYQRTSVPLPDNADRDNPKYSHMAVKVMGPGVFYDSLEQATGWPELKVGLPQRKTKLTVLSLFTPREVFVDFFRSSQGEEANPLDNDHGIPQALKLMNASQLNSVAPVVQRLTDSGKRREQVIEQLYLTTLARRPSAAETRLITGFLDRRKDDRPEQGYSAVLWTLINSAEFVSNH